jgi:hypothetical protein
VHVCSSDEKEKEADPGFRVAADIRLIEPIRNEILAKVTGNKPRAGLVG